MQIPIHISRGAVAALEEMRRGDGWGEGSAPRKIDDDKFEIMLEEKVQERLETLRQPGESYSHLLLRLYRSFDHGSSR